MLERAVAALARGMAWLGGLVLLAVVALVCVSVTGRALIGVGLGPVPGDYELVEMAMAFAIFACLPWCTFSRAHASVELFTERLGPAVNRVLVITADALMLLAALLITWRLYAGLLDKRTYLDTTFILQWPLWYSYAACLLAAVVFCVVCLYGLLRSLAGHSQGMESSIGKTQV